jgi:hypothetical protein
MDLSNPKPDADEDAGSLKASGSLEGDPDTGNKGSNLDTNELGTGNVSGGRLNSQPSAPHKEPLIKRLWHKLNIYLLLFLLLLVTAVAITVVMVLRSKKADPNNQAITSQGLSQDALEQLANSDTTVGSPKQILNIASNAVFSGAVLMRSNLEVAGTVKVGGELFLPGITVSGNSKLSEVQASSLAVSGPATIQGVFTAKNGMNVTGKSSFNGELSAAQLTTGSLQLNGDLKLTHHITAGGPIPSIARGTALGGGGTATVSGSDTAGSIAISTGNSPPAGCFATITFNRTYTNTPHIIISPVGSSAAELNYYVNRTTSNFSICATNAAPSGATFGFDYMALE